MTKNSEKSCKNEDGETIRPFFIEKTRKKAGKRVYIYKKIYIFLEIVAFGYCKSEIYVIYLKMLNYILFRRKGKKNGRKGRTEGLWQ